VGGTVEVGTTMFGGGSAPGEGVRSPVVRIAVPSAEAVARHLRQGDPAVIVRVSEGAVVVDLRTVDPADDTLVRDRLGAALR
jgi:L-seryl-tRNA(Ser) seleniumtransferase